MPTYKNTSGKTLELGGKRVKSGETVELLAWLEESPSLQKLADYPMDNPVILSQEITEDVIVRIPLRHKPNGFVTRFLIHMYVEKGPVEVWYNSFDNSPPLKLYTGGKWNVRCYERTINDVRIKFLSHLPEDKRMWINVERI